jgi:hypothetical protein
LILTDGLPVGSWREKLGLSSACQLYILQERETTQHAFLDCEEVRQIWDLFKTTKAKTDLQPAYLDWVEISRGLMTDLEGPSVDSDHRWDTASAFTINAETPWDACEPNCYGLYGVKDWLMLSMMKGFIWDLSYDTVGGILSMRLWRHSRSFTATNETKKKGKNILHVFNKFGQQLTSSEG